MKNYILSISIIFVSLFSFGQTDFYKDRLIFKVKEEHRNLCSKNSVNHEKLNAILNRLENVNVSKMFPNHFPPRVKEINGLPTVDISLMYQVNCSENNDIEQIAKLLNQLEILEYATVDHIVYPLSTYTPNDPNITNQWHLPLIKAFEAWAIEKGDTNVVIGITDTGIELTHPDLIGNIKYNYADPINGSDDDGDGYVDNFYGWDTGDNDNNPSFASNNHGIPVAGLAGATTDNNNQIAGTGFKAKILPIKIMNNTGQLSGAYQGIVYAADHGCNIINASWGSANSFNQAHQDFINYATINKNALVVCAAGNSNAPDLFYPASYQWALSVGGTNSSDVKWTSSTSEGSNYNYSVDITAPGVNVYSILNNGKTASGRKGTSISAPIVAGAAAILKSYDPNLTALQIAEQLKSTADNTDNIAGNENFKGLMGNGRLNMERMLTDFTKPGLQFYDIKTADLNNEFFTAGDTLRLWGNVANFLAETGSNSIIKISSNSAYIQILNNDINIGGLGTNLVRNIQNTPFNAVILENLPFNHKVGFLFEMIDVNYISRQYYELILNPDYTSYNNNNISKTITSKGKIGFNDGGNQTEGIGVKYNNGNNLLFQSGLIIGNANDKISFALDDDFTTEKSIEIKNPGKESQLDASAFYNDNNNNIGLGVSVIEKNLSWNKNGVEGSVIKEYTIKNTTNTELQNVYVSIFADWDIENYDANLANFDSINLLAYCYTANGIHAGIKLLKDTNFTHYAFQSNGQNGSINLYDGFSKTEQFAAISAGNARNSVSIATDVAQSMGAGPYNIPANQSIKVAFAMIIADNLNEIQNQAVKIDSAYYTIRNIDTDIAFSPIICADSCNGEIELFLEHGIEPFNITLNNQDINSYTFSLSKYDRSLGIQHQTSLYTIQNLCASNYDIQIQDAIGNSSAANINLNNPTPLTNEFINVVQENGNCVGFAQANPIGGLEPYSYSWNLSTSDSSIASNLCSGEYVVSITDSLGCVLKDTIVISIPTSNGTQNIAFVNIYPNPATQYIFIEFKGSNYDFVEILSLDGKKIMEQVIQSNLEKIELPLLKTGTYFVRLSNPKSNIVQKIIIH
jgi:serine protease